MDKEVAPFCRCGCGQKVTERYTRSNTRDNYKKGDWKKYVRGHNKAPRIGTGVNTILSSSILEKYHWYRWLSLHEIADIYDTTEHTIRYWMRKWNVLRWDNLYNFGSTLTIKRLHQKMNRLIRYGPEAFLGTVLCSYCGETLKRIPDCFISTEHFCNQSCQMYYQHKNGKLRAPFKWNKLEKKVYKYLVSKFGLAFIPHVRIPNYGFTDFYNPRLRIIIEVQGDYWHNLPENKERDRMKRFLAEAAGYQLIEIWEREVHDRF